MQNLPIGIQSFEKLRNDGYKYIDKSAHIRRLCNSGSYYFLSRPRRFGKSLLISTLKAYFEGKRHLFEGLDICQTETEWAEYPVLHIDFNTEDYSRIEALTNKINVYLCEWERLYGSSQSETTLASRFEGVIKRACELTGRQAVILVDEYDKPMLAAIGNPQLQEAYRNVMKGFYGALKSRDQYIKFALITGITKFSKVSIFSDLNNLTDISMNPRFYDICGITEEELRTQLRPEVEDYALFHHLEVEDVFAQLKANYDGYRFTRETEWEGKPLHGIYNPFSLLNTLQHKQLVSYWFASGTPTCLVELLQKNKYNLPRLETDSVTESDLSGVDSSFSSPIPVIYQSGYLTIKNYDPRFSTFDLCFPNLEVKKGFFEYLVPFYASKQEERSEFAVSKFVLAVERGDVEDFLQRVQAFLSGCSYELQAEQERHFQSVMYILSTLCGFYTEVECHTNRGRIDMTLKTDRYIYIFEFKFDQPASVALQQIRDKGYAEKFANDGREVVCIGASYGSKERNLSEWIIQ